MSHELRVESLQDTAAARIGRQIILLPETSSTNAYALDTLAQKEGPSSDGCVIFTEHQTAGRGRLGRSWQCPRGAGLMFTALLWEDPAHFSTARIIMATALAVAQGIEKSTDLDTVIHWPNDVYIKNRKVVGILVEARSSGQSLMPVAIGIGVNCLQQTGHFPPELRDKATSLEIESRQPVDRTVVARAILAEMNQFFAKPSRYTDPEMATAWRQRTGDIGQHVTLTCDGKAYSGRIVDVNPESGLLMQLDTGGRREFDLATITRAER